MNPDPIPGRPARRRGTRAGLAALLAAGALAAFVPWGAAQTPAPGDGEVARGRALWEENCASCHGPGGIGGPTGPPILDRGAAAVDFMVSTGRMPLADPAVPPVRREPLLDPRQIRALIAYLERAGLTGPAIPAARPSSGDLVLGQQLFQADCAACHGAAGAGGSVGGRVAPALDRATARQIAEAVRVGPGPMPPFGEDLLPQRELDSLVRYVLFLRGERDPGGLGLGRNGPVAEGFVAWFVGLGALVAVIRAVGTRT